MQKTFALLGLKWRSPFCLQCFGRRLSINLWEIPFCPSPFTLSWYMCLITLMGAFGTECESTWNNGLGALLLLKEGRCFIWGQKTGMKTKVRVYPLLDSEMHTPIHHAVKATRVGLCNQVDILHKMAASFSYHKQNALILNWYKYFLPGWSVGKYYTLTLLCKKSFCTVSWIIYPQSATIDLFYVQIPFAYTICVQI